MLYRNSSDRNPVTKQRQLVLRSKWHWQKIDGYQIDICLGPIGQDSDLPVLGKWQYSLLARS